MQPHPRVGVAAIVKDTAGRVVFGRRKGIHGAGHWQFPGGHLEFGEDVPACAARETLEETGLRVRPVRIVGVTNDVFAGEDKHYITLFVLCEREDEGQEPQNLEPHKCEGWFWKSWPDVVKMAASSDEANRLFLPIVNLVKQGKDPLNCPSI